MSFVTRYPPHFSSGPTFSVVFLLLQDTCRIFHSVLHISHQIQLQMDCGFTYMLRECVCSPSGLPVLLSPLVRFLFMFDFGQEPLQAFSIFFPSYVLNIYPFFTTFPRLSFDVLVLYSGGPVELKLPCILMALSPTLPSVLILLFSEFLLYPNSLHPCLLPRLSFDTFHRGLFSKAYPQMCLLFLVLSYVLQSFSC